MKKLIFTISTILISLSGFANAGNQQKVKELLAILQSDRIQSLLAREDGLGTLKGIEYLFSYRAKFGPAVYQLNFNSYSKSKAQICSVQVHVNTLSTEITNIDPATCKNLN